MRKSGGCIRGPGQKVYLPGECKKINSHRQKLYMLLGGVPCPRGCTWEFLGGVFLVLCMETYLFIHKGILPFLCEQQLTNRLIKILTLPQTSFAGGNDCQVTVVINKKISVTSIILLKRDHGKMIFIMSCYLQVNNCHLVIYINKTLDNKQTPLIDNESKYMTLISFAKYWTLSHASPFYR